LIFDDDDADSDDGMMTAVAATRKVAMMTVLTSPQQLMRLTDTNYMIDNAKWLWMFGDICELYSLPLKSSRN
jgi:hypothetical protein